MANYLSPLFNEQTFDTTTGEPLVNGQVATYVAGTSTPLATYTTQGGVTQQANPIILNARGEPTNPIWLGEGQLYKFILSDANGVPLRTIDDVGGINDASTSVSEWVASGFTPTYISATSFSVQGDKTGDFMVGRRIRSTNTGGTTYSLITSSSYNGGTGLTTIVVSNDSGILDSGLSSVDLSILTSTNTSLPNSQAGRQAIGLGFGDDIASSATLNLSARTGMIVRVTGTTPVTAVTMSNGDFVMVEAVGALPINVTGLLQYTCSAGDNILFWQDKNGTQSAQLFKNLSLPRQYSSLFDIDASVAANALTLTINPCFLDFRSTTLTDGTPVIRSILSSISLTVSSGSTLGTTNGVQSDIAVLAIDNAGTVEVAVVNMSGGVDLSETGLISTTAEGGAGAADSASVIYSTTARSNVAYRVVGFIRSTQATAGTWASAPSVVQSSGGNALPGIARYIVSAVIPTTSGTSVDFTNIPPWAKRIDVPFAGVSTNGTSLLQFQIGSGSFATSGYVSQAWAGTGSGGVITSGVYLAGTILAANIYTGCISFFNLGGNKWVATGIMNIENSSNVGYQFFGVITLAGVLDRVRLTTVSGADTFDAGSLSVAVQGF